MATNEQELRAALAEAQLFRTAAIEDAIVAITDTSGRLTFVNDRFCAISKFSREELLGEDLRIIKSGHHSKEFIRKLWTTISAGKTWRGEFKNRARNGSTYWVKTTVIPQLDEKGLPTHYISIGTDISEYESLRMTKAAFETVMQMETDRIFFKDSASRFVCASHALLKHFGVASFDELKGKADLNFFSEEHALAAVQDEQHVFRSGEPLVDKEEREIHADGRITWARTSKLPWHDKDGKRIGVMGVSRDITEWKQAQLEVDLWRTRFQVLLDSLPIGVAWSYIAADGRIVERMINDEHLRICGLSREEADSWTRFRSITHPDDAKRQDELAFQVARGKIDRYSLEKRYIRPDGQTVWVLFDYRTLQHEDGSSDDFTTVIDITDRKAS